MKHTALAAAAAAFLLSGCATIVKGTGPEPLTIRSHPADATVQVFDLRTNALVAAGRTPFTAVVPKSAGFFQGAKYRVEVELPGYEKREAIVGSSVSGWYVGGNLLFGGLIGWLIVDPASGAMWTLSPEFIDLTLEPAGVVPSPDKLPASTPTSMAPGESPFVAVVDVGSVPASALVHMVPVQ